MRSHVCGGWPIARLTKSPAVVRLSFPPCERGGQGGGAAHQAARRTRSKERSVVIFFFSPSDFPSFSRPLSALVRPRPPINSPKMSGECNLNIPRRHHFQARDPLAHDRQKTAALRDKIIRLLCSADRTHRVGARHSLLFRSPIRKKKCRAPGRRDHPCPRLNRSGINFPSLEL